MSPPLIDTPFARQLASKALESDAGAVVYVDREPRGPGAVALGSREVHVDREALLVFKDEAPGANWMHPCSYALVDVESGAVIARSDADRPPEFGRLAETWIVAADPETRADLLPPVKRQEEKDE